MSTRRAELIHIDVDRRLGHEWDEWDGRPLPNQGNFDTPPRRFFQWAVLSLTVAVALLAGLLFLLTPRLGQLYAPLPNALWALWGILVGAALLWWILVGLSYRIGTPLLPAALMERGLLLRVMRMTSAVAAWFHRRDWVENAGVKVYNRLALLRTRQVGTGELLLLIPRCLSRETLDRVLSLAGDYQVPVFVATRGQLARRVIRERRPRAVVAVACERDMVTGLHDVAAKVPVLGLTMTLPAGPCKDAALDYVTLEHYLQAFVGQTPLTTSSPDLSM